MKHFLFVFVLFLSFVSCKKDNTSGVTQGKNVAGHLEKNYHVDVGESTMDWRMTLSFEDEASPDMGFYGTIQVKSGNIKVISGQAVLAEFFTDPGTFVVVQPTGRERDLFVNELEKSGLANERGFFSMQLTLHKINYTNSGNFNAEISGLMDLNGVVKPVSFRANLNEEKNVFHFNSEEFEINLSEFDIEIPSEAGTEFSNSLVIQLDVTAKI